MATRLDNTRVIRAPRGPKLSAKSWLTEAPLRMLMNNLDPEVAEKPHELVVYGGIGRAARDWESFDRIAAALRDLELDETLLVQSGKPVGIFRTHADAPRILIANSNLVPHWATLERAQGRDDAVEALPVPRRPPDAAIDDELMRLLRDLRIEVVHQHAQRRLGEPALRRDLGAAGRADDAGVVDAGGAHEPGSRENPSPEWERGRGEGPAVGSLSAAAEIRSSTRSMSARTSSFENRMTWKPMRSSSSARRASYSASMA